MKHCPTCGDDKPLTEFGRNCQSPDGLHYYCKTCAALRQRAWYTNNPARAKAQRQKYLERIRAENRKRDPYVNARAA